MTATPPPQPSIASREEWLAARQALLRKEKELTRAQDALAAERRRLPMVKVDKNYVFEGPQGQVSLQGLFEGRRQLIVYHFMFAPEWKKGCLGCTGYVSELGDLSLLYERDTSFVLVSRAPLEKLERYKAEQGWSLPWVSSNGSDFNYDFHATLDEAIAPVVYNYRDEAELEQQGKTLPKGESHGLSVFFRSGDDIFHSYSTKTLPKGESHGLSVFFRSGDDIFHSYSTYARGCEGLTDTYSLLDTTPYGRQEDWEDSPPGWPQRPTYG